VNRSISKRQRTRTGEKKYFQSALIERPPTTTPKYNTNTHIPVNRSATTSSATTSKMENTNRLYLNFGNQDTRFQPADSRVYPTTPSSFPNPIAQAPQSGYQQTPAATYFQPPSQPGYQQAPQAPHAYPQQPGYQQAPQAPQAIYQQRSAAPNNDATNGLVHQFSHQNLGGAGRNSPYGSRQPSPSQRPRTAGATGQQAGYGSYLNAPMPSQNSQQQNWPEFQIAPERNPDKYGPSAQNNQTKCRTLAEAFFKDSVKRARDRNLRYVMPGILYRILFFLQVLT